MTTVRFNGATTRVFGPTEPPVDFQAGAVDELVIVREPDPDRTRPTYFTPQDKLTLTVGDREATVRLKPEPDGNVGWQAFNAVAAAAKKLGFDADAFIEERRQGGAAFRVVLSPKDPPLRPVHVLLEQPVRYVGELEIDCSSASDGRIPLVRVASLAGAPSGASLTGAANSGDDERELHMNVAGRRFTVRLPPQSRPVDVADAIVAAMPPEYTGEVMPSANGRVAYVFPKRIVAHESPPPISSPSSVRVALLLSDRARRQGE